MTVIVVLAVPVLVFMRHRLVGMFVRMRPATPGVCMVVMHVVVRVLVGVRDRGMRVRVLVPAGGPVLVSMLRVVGPVLVRVRRPVRVRVRVSVIVHP